MLNNDIVGGSRGSDGVVDDGHVRIFSEGPRADATDVVRATARRMGGENDSPSRNLSRFIAELGGPPLEVRQVWRADRMGRGGDHLPFQEAGIPAVRFSVAIEDYEHQHQDLRTDKGVKYGDTDDEMDFPYLARVTALNVKTLAALAKTPVPPGVWMEGAVSIDTVLRWNPVPGAAHYRVYRRRTDAPQWEDRQVLSLHSPAPGPDGAIVARLPGLRADDWILGVSASADGLHESPIASAVPGGAFAPPAK